jgi:hypothetical protein
MQHIKLPRHLPRGNEQRTNVFFRIDITSSEIRREHLPNKILTEYDIDINHLTPNDLKRRRAVNPLKIKITSKKSRQAALRGGI